MALTIGDLLKLPESINNELERRSNLRAEALSSKILNKITSEEISPNPLSFNPYYKSSNEQNNVLESEDKFDSNNWGKGGW